MLNKMVDIRRQDGFTLIELMIVMVVLGILAGIVLFATGTFSSDASTAKNSANARICATAKAASAAAHSGDTSHYADYIDSSTPITCS